MRLRVLLWTSGQVCIFAFLQARLLQRFVVSEHRGGVNHIDAKALEGVTEVNDLLCACLGCDGVKPKSGGFNG